MTCDIPRDTVQSDNQVIESNASKRINLNSVKQPSKELREFQFEVQKNATLDQKSVNGSSIQVQCREQKSEIGSEELTMAKAQPEMNKIDKQDSGFKQLSKITEENIQRSNFRGGSDQLGTSECLERVSQNQGTEEAQRRASLELKNQIEKQLAVEKNSQRSVIKQSNLSLNKGILLFSGPVELLESSDIRYYGEKAYEVVDTSKFIALETQKNTNSKPIITKKSNPKIKINSVTKKRISLLDDPLKFVKNGRLKKTGFQSKISLKSDNSERHKMKNVTKENHSHKTSDSVIKTKVNSTSNKINGENFKDDTNSFSNSVKTHKENQKTPNLMKMTNTNTRNDRLTSQSRRGRFSNSTVVRFSNRNKMPLTIRKPLATSTIKVPSKKSTRYSTIALGSSNNISALAKQKRRCTSSDKCKPFYRCNISEHPE